MCFCILSAVFVYFPLSKIMLWWLIVMLLPLPMQTKETLKHTQTHTQTHTQHTHRSHMQIFQAPSGITWHPAHALAPVTRAWFELFGCCHGPVMQCCCCFFAGALWHKCDARETICCEWYEGIHSCRVAYLLRISTPQNLAFWSVMPFLSHRKIFSFHKWLPTPFLFFPWETVAQINAKADKWVFTVLVQCQCVKHSNPCYSTFQNQIKTYILLYLFNWLR